MNPINIEYLRKIDSAIKELKKEPFNFSEKDVYRTVECYLYLLDDFKLNVEQLADNKGIKTELAFKELTTKYAEFPSYNKKLVIPQLRDIAAYVKFKVLGIDDEIAVSQVKNVKKYFQQNNINIEYIDASDNSLFDEFSKKLINEPSIQIWFDLGLPHPKDGEIILNEVDAIYTSPIPLSFILFTNHPTYAKNLRLKNSYKVIDKTENNIAQHISEQSQSIKSFLHANNFFPDLDYISLLSNKFKEVEYAF